MSEQVDPKMPELEDFGVTPEQYAAYVSKVDFWGAYVFAYPLAFVLLASLIASISFAYPISGVAIFAFALLALVFGWPLTIMFILAILFLFDSILLQFKRHRLLKGPVVSRIKQYEDAQAAAYEEAQAAAQAAYAVAQAAAYEADRQKQEAEWQRRRAGRARQAEQRKREQYWKSLGGIEFERELGKLFAARGYDVRYTGGSGDQGGDLILRKDGETTVVQCKAWKNPATPQVARELGGSMMHYKANNGILACTGGFSGGVLEFARGKPITLIDARDIARMAVESGDGMPDVDESPPACPMDGCGSDMVVRNGRYGSFWGCSRYPACQGRRAFVSRSLFR